MGEVDAPLARVHDVLAYHDRTKHQFHRFAPALGYLDWATQPDPFRRYAGAPIVALPHTPVARTADPAALSLDTVGELLRCALGLTAWKQAGASRWALRANPSSGNLHPTEGYVVAPGLGGDGWRVCHYAPREHALEVRAALAGVPALPPGVALVGLSSIYWREAWKYGERAFRYCQHDVGHAIGACVYAGATLGWRVRVLPGWPDDALAALLGLEAAAPDDPEREHPDCVLAVGPGDVDALGLADVGGWVRAARAATWSGTPNRLSPSHVAWPAIDAAAGATRDAGVSLGADRTQGAGRPCALDRRYLLQRRSAVAFDGQTALDGPAFARMRARLMPSAGAAGADAPAPVWDALAWTPHVQLIWFVHRVTGLASGIYAQVRQPASEGALRAGLRDDLLWERVPGPGALHLLAPLDSRGLARRLSCDQDIAADGFLSLAMLAPLESALVEGGAAFYRPLFWECGLVGQVLYLEAEAAGARATGIGCFYDDAVHDVLGIRGHAWQSLYHFSMGIPVEDRRLQTGPGYEWEPAGPAAG